MFAGKQAVGLFIDLATQKKLRIPSKHLKLMSELRKKDTNQHSKPLAFLSPVTGEFTKFKVSTLLMGSPATHGYPGKHEQEAGMPGATLLTRVTCNTHVHAHQETQ